MTHNAIDLSFIADPRFARILESDVSEMHRCADAHCLKAATVIAGGVLEALLSDCSISVGVAEKAVLDCDLAQLAETAVKAGLLTPPTSSACAAVRNWRNLIHPGRSIRKGQGVTGHSMQTALGLVGMVAEELGTNMRATRPLTADVLWEKVRNDSYSVANAKLLVAEMMPREVIKAALHVWPKEYAGLSEVVATGFGLSAGDDGAVRGIMDRMPPFMVAFRAAADEAGRDRIAMHFLGLLKTGTDVQIGQFGRAFLAAEDVTRLKGPAREMALTHLFSIEAGREYPDVLYRDLLPALSESEALAWVDMVLALIADGKGLHQDLLRNPALDALRCTPSVRQAMADRAEIDENLHTLGMSEVADKIVKRFVELLRRNL